MQDLGPCGEAFADGGVVALSAEGRAVIILVQQHQVKLGEGAQWGGTVVTGLNGECVVLLFLAVKDLRGADDTSVTVDGEATSVVLTWETKP